MPHETRETWLEDAIKILRPLFEDLKTKKGDPIEAEPAERIEAIVSWPKGHKTAIGQCFDKDWTKEEATYITVSPELEDPVRVLDVLVHEMIHACGIFNHGPAFKKVALAVGLTGKMKHTVAGEDLRARLVEFAETLGPYPHVVMKNLATGTGRPKGGQGTRIKVGCPEHEDYTIDMVRRKFESGEQAAPLCPDCHTQLEPLS